jgi:hypothetical protein
MVVGGGDVTGVVGRGVVVGGGVLITTVGGGRVVGTTLPSRIS